jgi:hypothetical protein
VALISFEADSTIEPSPYKSALSKLVVVKGQGPTRISLKDEEEVYIEGSSYCLEALASFFEFKPDAEKGAHSGLKRTRRASRLRRSVRFMKIAPIRIVGQ